MVPPFFIITPLTQLPITTPAAKIAKTATTATASATAATIATATATATTTTATATTTPATATTTTTTTTATTPYRHYSNYHYYRHYYYHYQDSKQYECETKYSARAMSPKKITPHSQFLPVKTFYSTKSRQLKHLQAQI